LAQVLLLSASERGKKDSCLMDLDLTAKTASRPTTAGLTGRRYALCKAHNSSIWRLCRELENKRDVLPESLDNWTLQLLRDLDGRSAGQMDRVGKGSPPEMAAQQSGPSDSKIWQPPRRNERPRCALKELPDMASLQLLRLQFAEPDQQLLEFIRPLGSILVPEPGGGKD